MYNIYTEESVLLMLRGSCQSLGQVVLLTSVSCLCSAFWRKGEPAYDWKSSNVFMIILAKLFVAEVRRQVKPMRSDHRKKKRLNHRRQICWSDRAPFTLSTKSWRVKSAHRESALLSFFFLKKKKRPRTRNTDEQTRALFFLHGDKSLSEWGINGL